MILEPGTKPASSRALSLVRVRPGQDVPLELISFEPLWVKTHWLEKQFLCPGIECPVCGGGEGRNHGYLIVRIRDKRAPKFSMLELTAPSWEQFLTLSKMTHDDVIAGTLLNASRRKKNSPLTLEPMGIDAKFDLENSSVTRVLDAMAILYGLPVSMPSESPSEWSTRVTPVAVSLLNSAIAK